MADSSVSVVFPTLSCLSAFPISAFALPIFSHAKPPRSVYISGLKFQVSSLRFQVRLLWLFKYRRLGFGDLSRIHT